MIEAYPSPDGKAYRYMGTRELYRAAGFDEVPVRGSRPVMRRPSLGGQPVPGQKIMSERAGTRPPPPRASPAEE